MTHSRSDQVNKCRRQLRPHIGTGKHVVVVAQPKSGSTALCAILSEITGWPVASYADRAVHGFAFSAMQATQIANADRVIHLHSLPTPVLCAWLAERRMVPAVLHRDIAAGLVSMYHHDMRTDAAESERLRALPYERGVEETVWTWAAWMARFQRTWRQTLRRDPGIWIDHAELFAAPGLVAARVLAANDIEVSPANAEAAARRVLGDPKRSNNHHSTGDLPQHLIDAITRLSS